MKSRACFAITAVALLVVQSAFAHEVEVSALLTGSAESPPNGSPGIGSAQVTLDLDVITLRVQASFSGLIGTTTAAHINAPTTTAGVGIAGIATQLPTLPGFPIGVTSGIYDQTIDLTVASSYNPAFITSSGGTVSQALNALIFALEDGKAYLNIETTAVASGEIRGFLVPVPEPATLGLAAVGMAAIVAVRARTRRVSR